MYKLAFLTLLSATPFISGAPTRSSTSSILARHARLSKLKVPSSVVDTDRFHFPQDLYGGFFDALDSWEDSPSITTTTATTGNVPPTPTGDIVSLDHPPYMGPGIELAPASSTPSTPSNHPYAPGLHKLVAVITVVGGIGLVVIICFLINERQSFSCHCLGKKRKQAEKQLAEMKDRERESEREKDMKAWRTRYLLSSASPRSRYLTPPSPSECGSELDIATPPLTPLPNGGCEVPKSKWSMTISDFGGASPRTSGSPSLLQEQFYPPILVSPPPRVYNPISFESDESDYPFSFRFGHARNRSAPPTPSIASSASDVNVEGRSSSSSTSSGRVTRVHWR